MTPPPHPRLKANLDAQPALTQDGDVVIQIHDREGLAESLAVSPNLARFLFEFLDGGHDRAAVQKAWETRAPTSPDALAAILERLDEGCLLEGERLDEARRAALDAYRAQPRREAVFVEHSYPRDPADLTATLEAWRAEAGVEVEPGSVRAVIAPHIEPRGGRLCHGAAAAAIEACPAEVFVVLGTAHQMLSRPFALTSLDFDTPAGTLTTDREIVKRLAQRGGGGLLDAERIHAIEHSVEFQAVWIRLLHATRKDLRIVPVIVGSQIEAICAGTQPGEVPAVADFVAALRELRAEYGDGLALVASVDFAHVGPMYGDSEAPDESRLATVMAADEELLAHASALDAEAWFRYLHAEQDGRNVCGATPTWVLLAALAGSGLRGRVLRHDIWEIHPETHSHVSFATVAYEHGSESDA